jgi:formylglycine-generating enzyme required for sulfatase activity
MLDQAQRNRRRRQQPVRTWLWLVGGVALLALLISLLWWALGDRPTPVATLGATQTGASESPPVLPPAAASLHLTCTRPSDEMVMVYVPGGTFAMGSQDGESDEQPVHQVTLDGFWLDQTEVTNAQFVAFLEEEGNQTEGGVTWLDMEDEHCLIEQSQGQFQPKRGHAHHPVIQVSWYAAAAYCEWAGAQLPTEAEWEYAAQGEQVSVYPWGDEAPTCSLAQYYGCSGRTVPVGSYPEGASWCDALDMAGNVWEWTASLYEPYPYDEDDGRNDPEAEGSRVLRGGSWYNLPVLMRSGLRFRLLPTGTGDFYGFRCARDSD